MAELLLVRGLAGSPRAVLVEDGRIAALDREAEAAGIEARTVDGDGLTAHPGFIDLQVNGIDRFDFTSHPTSIASAGRALARHGVTAFLPTIISSPPGTVEAALAALRLAGDGATPIGLHVEGPFIAPGRCGAHDPASLREPDLDELRSWVTAGVRMVTLAPELRGALDAISLVVATGAVAAIGHTDADARTTTAAIEAGARYATHLFNAMPPLSHRAPGPVGALVADDRVSVGLIADGLHVDPLVLGLVARAAAGRVSLVSDAVGASLSGQPVRAGRLADGTLAGGVRGLDHGVRTFAAVAGRDAAIAAVTTIPARLLALDDGRGEIRVGGRADLVLLTRELEVAATIIRGDVAFERTAP